MATTREEALKQFRGSLDKTKDTLQKKISLLQAEANANPNIVNTPEFQQELAETREFVQNAYEDEKFYQKEINKGSENKKQREIDCPVCGAGKRKQMTNDVPKPAQSDAANSRFRSTALKKISAAIGDVAKLLKLGNSSERTKTTQSILGKCPRCGNKNKIKDPTDRSKQQEAAAKKAEALQEQILQTEAEMGPPGGNDLKIVVGDKHLEVGLGYNDTPSYTVLENQGLAMGGGKITKDGMVADYEKVNAVVGTNPLSTSGGKYSIKCANSFKVRAGSQGIELNTEGPLIIKAGQTQFVGPEITIGSSKGQVAIEGNNLSLGGKNVVINAGADSNGQISFNGSVFATGNFNAQGGAHFEGDVSCNSMTMPGKSSKSQISSQDTQVTGAAVWQQEAATQALKNFVRVRQLQNTPDGRNLTNRDKENTAAEQKDLLKKSLPIEGQPCGYALVNGVPNPVFLYPHHHTLDDMVHDHDLGPQPNIQVVPDSQTLRQMNGSKTLAAPAPCKIETSNIVQQIFYYLKTKVTGKQTVR